MLGIPNIPPCPGPPGTSLTAAIAGVLLLSACGDDDSADSDTDMSAAVETYADGVHASNAASLASAITLGEAIDTPMGTSAGTTTGTTCRGA
jgi:uncharacterized iron-regulated protein